MRAYKIKSNLSERQIEADVSMYLGWCCAGMPVRLLDVNEQLTGADRKYDVVTPIYLQFKKSHGLAPLRTGVDRWVPGFLRPSDVGPLQAIRRFRSFHQLADDPTLYFQIRAKANGAEDFQHNVLLAHHRPGAAYAVYVAPLYLDKDAYYRDLYAAPRYVADPWIWKQADVLGAWGLKTWLSQLSRLPYLKNHISIAPHERVTDDRHFYAFSSAGDEVSWHSPELREGGLFRLSDFLVERLSDMMFNEERLAEPADGLQVAISVLEGLGVDPADILRGETSFDRLQSYGKWLHNAFGIRQVLMCTERKTLQTLRAQVVR